MTGFRAATTALLVLGLAATTAAGTYAARSGAADSDGDRKIAMRDDCNPKDPGWGAVGGCARKQGNVSFAEFIGELDSPLAAAVIGNQSWRFDPSYLVITRGKTVQVKNAGGRPHTFTKVAAFGGGKVPLPALNEGLTTAPECPGSTDIAPGGSMILSGLAVGNHRLMCCIHPWMRALIKVKPKGDNDNDD